MFSICFFASLLTVFAFSIFSTWGLEKALGQCMKFFTLYDTLFISLVNVITPRSLLFLSIHFALTR